MSQISSHKATGMLLLDYFAAYAPEPSKKEIQLQKDYDSSRAHQNSSYMIREEMQIKCELRHKWASMMMKVR